ncbi:MAG: 16S rRNA (cytosine(1402)-N(4))-methyltransferase RsmH [Calditrichaeota bacterium]|nr:16S rRNA (cytosine(1402)-N(4))-methyltransferase RsmH [Calditrichota bacterium]
MTDAAGYHSPVLLNESIEWLVTDPTGIYIDCTLGGGGHSMAILEKLKGGKLFSIDRDADAISFAQKRLTHSNNSFIRQGRFSEMDELCELADNSVAGVLMDLGVSSWQINSGERGFSFQADGPLDMRMNREQPFSAYDLVNTYDLNELKHVFYRYGEEKKSQQIAKQIIARRNEKPIETTAELKSCIVAVVKGKEQVKSLARVFQAIRIEVNREMEELETALKTAFRLLANKGRLVVISYHSLEDRIAKQFMRSQTKQINTELPFDPESTADELKIVTKKPVLPSNQEINENSRSRSARLRVAEKISGGKK